MNGNLVAALDRRVKSVVSDNSLSVLQVFDALWLFIRWGGEVGSTRW